MHHLPTPDSSRGPAHLTVPNNQTEEHTTMLAIHPIHVPEEWHDHDLLTFEEFCELICTPVRTVRDWRRRSVGPRWTKLEGCGRLYISVAEVRRFLHATTNAPLSTPPIRTQRAWRTA